MKHIEIELMPNIFGSKVIIDGEELKGVIKVLIIADAEDRDLGATLEIESIRMSENDQPVITTNERGEKSISYHNYTLNNGHITISARF